MKENRSLETKVRFVTAVDLKNATNTQRTHANQLANREGEKLSPSPGRIPSDASICLSKERSREKGEEANIR